jgi:hypothetical protein
MSLSYSIQRASSPLGTPDLTNDTLWAHASQAPVTHFSWKDSGHRPDARGHLLYDDDWLAVRFTVQDQYVRAVAEKFNDSVCSDSCVEFFVAPNDDPAQSAYFNFEVNCGGTMLLFACPSPAQRNAGADVVHVSEEDGSTIQMAATLPKIVEPELTDPTLWAVEYHVPWALFEKYFDVERPQPGQTWRGNFYKCGDRTSHPHWGSWSPVDTPSPSFHQPDFYQSLRFA